MPKRTTEEIIIEGVSTTAGAAAGYAAGVKGGAALGFVAGGPAGAIIGAGAGFVAGALLNNAIEEALED